jgi:hypothetical protein
MLFLERGSQIFLVQLYTHKFKAITEVEKTYSVGHGYYTSKHIHTTPN